jgi:hypothetical protein
MHRKLLYLARLLVVGIIISTLTSIFGVSLTPFQVDLVRAATADPQSVSTDEDTPIDITLTGSDSGVCELTFTITSNPSDGSLGAITNQDCVAGTPNTDSAIVTYTPASNFNGSDSFEFQVDNGTETSSATVSITINTVNDAPSFTKGDNQTVNEDSGAHTVTGWASGMSPGPANESGQTLTFQVTNDNNTLFSTQPAVNATTGNLTFTPAPDAFGSANVNVTLKDDGGTANGGTDSSPTQSFVITVDPINDAPSFTKGADQAVNEDAGAQTVASWATGISAGPNESSQTLTFHVSNDNNTLFSAQPAISPLGTLTFTPTPDAFGSANVDVYLTDDGGTANGGADTSSTQSFAITVNSVNDAPSFTKGGNQTVNEDSGAHTVTGWASGMSPGPANESGQTLTFQVSNDNNALFSVQPAVDATTGNLAFTPAPDAFGSSTVTISLQDDGGTANGGDDLSDPQTFLVTVDPLNDNPIANPDNKSTAEDTPLSFPASDLTSNDLPGPSNEITQTLSVSNVTTTIDSHGTVSLTSGSITYTPESNFNGLASFEYTVCDDGVPVLCSTGTVNVAVSSSNDPPIANPDTKNAIEDTPLTFPSSDLTVNDSPGAADESTQSLSVTDVIATINTHGNVSLNSGNVTYVPETNINGAISFQYTVCDNGVPIQCVPGTTNVTVAAVNDPPSFTRGPDQTLNEDSGATTVPNWATAISRGPTDEASQTLTFIVTNDNPSLFSTAPTINSAGTLTFATAANANGLAHATVVLQDSGSSAPPNDNTSDPQTFTITINPTNDPPVALSDPYDVKSGEKLIVDAPGVLDNDQDIDGDTLMAQIVSLPSHGILDLKSDGSFSYTPDLNFTDVDTFTYRAYDGTAYSAVTDVEIDVYDGTKPQVEFMAPVETGDQLDVYNQIVCLKVDAKDDIKVDRVRFYWWDSLKSKYVELGVDEDPPFEWCFDTVVLNGGYRAPNLLRNFNQIFAEAYDNSGNISSRKWIWLYKVADVWRALLPFVVH